MVVEWGTLLCSLMSLRVQAAKRSAGRWDPDHGARMASEIRGRTGPVRLSRVCLHFRFGVSRRWWRFEGDERDGLRRG